MADTGITIFGVGRMGKIHTKNVNDHSELKILYLVDEYKENIAKAVNLRNKVEILDTKESQRALEDEKVKSCIVATPYSTHKEIVKKCLDKRKNVLCEKPLCPTLQEAKELFKLSENNGLTLMVNFQRRFDPQIRKVYDMIQEGAIGQLRVIKTTSRDPPAMVSPEYLKNSPGLFFDSAVHDMDVICWLANSKPTSIYVAGSATDKRYKELGDVDSCAITITFENSVIGVVEVSRNAVQGYDQRLEVFGSKGTLQTENKRHTSVNFLNERGERIDPMIQNCMERYDDAYKNVLNHFVKATSGTEELIVKPSQVLMVTHLAELCRKSLRNGTKEMVTETF